MQVSLILQWFRNVLVEFAGGLLIVHLVKWEEVREVREMTRGWGAPGHPIKPREAKYLLYILPASQPSVRLRNLPARRQGASRPVLS
jgi:hypothetical protein